MSEENTGSKATSCEMLVENWRRISTAMANSYDRIEQWCKKLTGFSELSQCDQQVLLSAAFLELLVLRISCATMHAPSMQSDSATVFADGTVLHKWQLAAFFGEWLEQMSDFRQSLQRLDLDQQALACMMALALITERPGLQDSNSVAELQLKVVEALRNYCVLGGGQGASSPTSSAGLGSRSQPPLLFSRMLGKLPDLRSLSEQGLHKLYQLKMNGYTLPSKIDALLFPSSGNNNNLSSYLLRA